MKQIMEQIDVQETNRSNGSVNIESHADDGSPGPAMESTGTPHEQQGTTPEQSGEDAGANTASELEFHEYANIFPMLSDEELEELSADIKENGLNDPVTLYQGKVLDGRNRTRACEMAGIEPVTTEFEDGDPLAFVISKNTKRRHLSVSQRAMAAEKLANLKKGEHKNPKQENLPISDNKKKAAIAQEEAAKVMNISSRQVRSAAKLRRDATDRPELIDEVEQGKKTVHAALHELKLPKLYDDGAADIVILNDFKCQSRQGVALVALGVIHYEDMVGVITTIPNPDCSPIYIGFTPDIFATLVVAGLIPKYNATQENE